ncbi:MAG: hypothetical protein FWF44_05315 [Defluviitaleaceae bacterium]|nr:hypothetical protein [Defluviitaleaceae bacterium]
MRTYKKAQIDVLRKDKTVCNICGAEIAGGEYLDLSLRIEKTWGYGSPWDGERHAADICLACYGKMLENMAIKPFEEEVEDLENKKNSCGGY